MNIKHEIEKKPEFSGSSAQVLAALQADNRSRTPSTIIRRHRAAKALAASRMAAQVALDKLEARAGDEYDPEEAAAEAERREHPKLVDYRGSY